jgi:hypothetical protein
MASPHGDGLDLHRRLAEGHVTASAELAEAYLEPLVERLRQKNSNSVPDEMLVSAAEDAIIALIRNPSSYKSEKHKSLFDYLDMSAQGDLINHFEREKTYRKRNVSLNLVELSEDGGNYLGEEDAGLTRLEAAEELQLAEPFLCAVRQGLDERECEFLDLMLQGERKTELFAAVLGIENLPSSDQQKHVKRMKDKLDARIRRERSRHVEPS